MLAKVQTSVIDGEVCFADLGDTVCHDVKTANYNNILLLLVTLGGKVT